LIIPYLERKLPQYLVAEALVKVLRLYGELKDGTGIIMGYNSAGAFSSINHLHWHLIPI